MYPRIPHATLKNPTIHAVAAPVADNDFRFQPDSDISVAITVAETRLVRPKGCTIFKYLFQKDSNLQMMVEK